MKTNLKLASYTMACLAFALCAPPTFAGGISDGGGSAVGGVPTSFAENTGSLLVDPTELRGFEIVEQVLKTIEGATPPFAALMRNTLTAKDWYLEPKALTDCRDDGSLVVVNSKVVACQNDLEVRIDREWFEKVAESDMARAQLIVHELNRSIYLARNVGGMKIKPEYVHYMDRLFFKSPFPAQGLLQKKLDQLGYGWFRTTDDINQAVQIVNDLKDHLAREYCQVTSTGGTDLQRAALELVEPSFLSSTVGSSPEVAQLMLTVQRMRTDIHFNRARACQFFQGMIADY